MAAGSASQGDRLYWTVRMDVMNGKVIINEMHHYVEENNPYAFFNPVLTSLISELDSIHSKINVYKLFDESQHLEEDRHIEKSLSLLK